MMGKAFRAGADAVILDLEDAVPEAEKADARACVRAALSLEAAARPPVPVFVRINGLASGHWRSDVEAVICPDIAGIRVPKVEDVESLCRLSDAITARENSLGLAAGSIPVVATIESARGLADLGSVARGPRIRGFAFGAADYAADLGADPQDDRATLLARSLLVLTSRSERLAAPVASVFTRLSDDAGLRADTLSQKALGFFGRSAIHPRQLPIIHEAFDPTPAEVERARKEIAAYEAAHAQGRGAVQAGGGFVDLAVVRRARSVMELHEATAEKRHERIHDERE